MGESIDGHDVDREEGSWIVRKEAGWPCEERSRSARIRVAVRVAVHVAPSLSMSLSMSLPMSLSASLPMSRRTASPFAHCACAGLRAQLTVLVVTREAQAQNGLRHGDHDRYRCVCLVPRLPFLTPFLALSLSCAFPRHFPRLASV